MPDTPEKDAPPPADFVHLRLHSAYSLSEGAIRLKDLVKQCRKFGMPAVAVTDTNNLFGALEFSLAARGEGVQPIIGCQLTILPGDDGQNGGAMGGQGGCLVRERSPSVVLLVKDDTGYRNLLKLLKAAYLDAEEMTETGVRLETLLAHNQGLILLTGGPAGPVGRELVHGQTDKARALLTRLAGAFDGRTYVEIQRHGMDAENATEAGFLDLAYELDLPLVATNEAFYPTPDMFEAHDALICIAESAYVSTPERRRLTPQHWFKGAPDMRALFADLPEAVDNTMVIAKRCAFMVEKVDPILPAYDCGDGRTEQDELRAQAAVGLEARLEAHVYEEGMDATQREEVAKPYRERLEYELGVIIDMGFPGYFLIVADFIGWAKERGIPVGPGRGSGAGSVVAWSLSITDLDPLRFGLLFERFLNPERVSMPDFDIDFCQDRRDEVIRYVQARYGHGHVAQIITFGKLQARAVLRDVGRVLEMPYGYIDKICKLVPNNPANPVTLEEAVEGEPQIRRMMAEDPQVQYLISLALKLEGLYRHASTHAAGVVIGDRPLEDLIPLYRDPRSDLPVTGFNMKFVESAGLVKFDFLGLKTLTVLAKAVELCRDKRVELDLSTIPLDDAKTFQMIGDGHTTGVFQLESEGMRDVLKQMKADAFEDIIAVVALYRPGPMDNIPSYIARKKGEEEPDYLYPTLQPVLQETFGIMIYQEQVMQAAQELSGYTLGGADLLRRAMGKKIKAEMDQQREIFVSGAEERGVDKRKASDIFDQVAKFAGYGFNKSHAAAYALVAYQTAYMKANHPVEFLAASMTLDMHNTDKLAVFKRELRDQGIDLLPPDVNKSFRDFSVERKGEASAIRYALTAIKNVGGGAMEALVAERTANGPFKSLSDFARRLDPKLINKRQMENLIRAGGLDALNPNRRQLFSGLEKILNEANIAHAERNSDQMGLFGGGGGAQKQPDIRLDNIADWSTAERLQQELDAVGFYLSAHPLDDYETVLRKQKVQSYAEVVASGRPGQRRMAGTFDQMKERTSAKGARYAFVTFSDPTGTFEGIMFSEVLAANREVLQKGQAFVIEMDVQIEVDTSRFMVQGLKSLDAVASTAITGLTVVIDGDRPLAPLAEVLMAQERGQSPIYVVPRLEDRREVVIGLDRRFKLSPAVIAAVKSVSGVLEVRED
ncbi:MAG: DNA polymerase III subunit alpha [Rhodospirillaceae bacterium]